MEADEHTLQHMEEHPEDYPQSDFTQVRSKSMLPNLVRLIGTPHWNMLKRILKIIPNKCKNVISTYHVLDIRYWNGFNVE
jgi:hypothetical protein